MTSVAARKRAHKAARRLKPAAPRHAKVEPQPKPAKPPPVDRDGLEWLQRKKRLTAQQHLTALTYRKAYRDAGEVGLRSCLNDQPRGGGGDHMACAIVASADAKAWLAHVRGKVLAGQVDMLTVMDGVCGSGRTLRELAGGNDRKAAELEAILKVALDLVWLSARVEELRWAA